VARALRQQPRAWPEPQGGPDVVQTRPLEERFWEKVDKRGPYECWPWLACTRGGYGLIWSKDQQTFLKAHRVSFEFAYGALPIRPARRGVHGVMVRHTCDNTLCVNPAHLLSGTQFDNMRDMVARGRRPSGPSLI
jgi:hypothetical protein